LLHIRIITEKLVTSRQSYSVPAASIIDRKLFTDVFQRVIQATKIVGNYRCTFRTNAKFRYTKDFRLRIYQWNGFRQKYSIENRQNRPFPWGVWQNEPMP
jgi:hypothetical protein